MRIIVCGAGSVGYNIASYLSRENNDVTLIDNDPDTIARVNRHLDANGIVGNACSPDILARAGAQEADLIIAVTRQDEVNMVACQVAHSIFNVPKKIARIRNQFFRDPKWSNLFSRAHMPIDVIISPEVEAAKAIEMRLAIPGTTMVTPLSAGNLYMCGVLCEHDCPLVNTPLRQLDSLFPDNRLRIMTIIRGGEPFIPKADDQMLIGDEVFFVAEKNNLPRILSRFGHEEKDTQHIIIVGGGNIGVSLVQLLQKKYQSSHLKLIEIDEQRAHHLSDILEDVIVLNASALDKRVLEEANIHDVDTLVAVSNDDETNILTCLLARQYGCERVVPLVNKSTYNTLTASLGLGTVLSPKAITVSTVMRHVRRGRIKAIHNLINFAELLEVEASNMLNILNTPIKDLNLPEGVVLSHIIRDGAVILVDGMTSIKAQDLVVVLAERDKVKKVEKLFSAQVDIF